VMLLNDVFVQWKKRAYSFWIMEKNDKITLIILSDERKKWLCHFGKKTLFFVEKKNW